MTLWIYLSRENDTNDSKFRSNSRAIIILFFFFFLLFNLWIWSEFPKPNDFDYRTLSKIFIVNYCKKKKMFRFIIRAYKVSKAFTPFSRSSRYLSPLLLLAYFSPANSYDAYNRSRKSAVNTNVDKNDRLTGSTINCYEHFVYQSMYTLHCISLQSTESSFLSMFS